MQSKAPALIDFILLAIVAISWLLRAKSGKCASGSSGSIRFMLAKSSIINLSKLYPVKVCPSFVASLIIDPSLF